MYLGKIGFVFKKLILQKTEEQSDAVPITTCTQYLHISL